jgi:hypothetical protein
MQLEAAIKEAESWQAVAEECKENFLKERNVRRKLHDQLQVGNALQRKLSVAGWLPVRCSGAKGKQVPVHTMHNMTLLSASLILINRQLNLGVQWRMGGTCAL